jgi:hypothetical protein
MDPKTKIKLKVKLKPSTPIFTETAALTETAVVNVKVEHLRKDKRYNNIQEWLADPKNVYIGRQARINVNGTYVGIKSSPWSNEYTVKEHGREEALRLYRAKLTARLSSDPILVKQLCELNGKTLGCWCAPDPCHGHVLLELLSVYKA